MARWKTIGFIGHDPAGGEGIDPIRSVTIKAAGDLQLHRRSYDHRLDLQFGVQRHLLGRCRRHEDLFPDLPLNSGFYRCFDIIAPGSIIDAQWPIAVTGF